MIKTATCKDCQNSFSYEAGPYGYLRRRCPICIIKHRDKRAKQYYQERKQQVQEWEKKYRETKNCACCSQAATYNYVTLIFTEMPQVGLEKMRLCQKCWWRLWDQMLTEAHEAAENMEQRNKDWYSRLKLEGDDNA